MLTVAAQYANYSGDTELLLAHRHRLDAVAKLLLSLRVKAQAAAWEAYIQQDDYLREHRGEYAQRGAVFLPLVKRLDFSASQDLFTTLKGRRHSFQFRVDFINFGNLLSSDWGVAQRLVSNSPLVLPTTAQGGVVDALGRAQYRLRVVDGELMTRSLQQTADLNDVWRIQFMLRYTFN